MGYGAGDLATAITRNRPVASLRERLIKPADDPKIREPRRALAEDAEEIPGLPRVRLHGGGTEEEDTARATLQLQVA